MSIETIKQFFLALVSKGCKIMPLEMIMPDRLYFHNLPSEVATEFYVDEIAALRATIALMQEEKRMLQREVRIGRRKIALMQAALTQCRLLIENYQSEPKFDGCPSRKKNLSSSIGWVPLRRVGKSALVIWGLPKKSDVPRYITRSDLETIILQTAATRVGGILGVVIEAKQLVDSGDVTNWRIAGIISGKTDRSVALEAVMRAAEQYVKWVVVDDESYLHGRAIADKITLASPRGDFPTQVA